MLSSEQTRNTYLKLEEFSIPSNQKYSIYAYFISDDYDPKAEGGNSSVAGMIIPLGTYSTQEEVREQAMNIVTKTGHKAVFACETGRWQALKDEEDVDRTELIPVDKKGKLDQAFYQELEKERKMRERVQRVRDDIDMSMEEAKNKHSLSAYIDNWTNMSDNINTINILEERIQEMKQAYEKRKLVLKEQEKANPEYKKKWLKEVDESLHRRNESSRLPYILQGFTRIIDMEGMDRNDYNPYTS